MYYALRLSTESARSFATRNAAESFALKRGNHNELWRVLNAAELSALILSERLSLKFG